MSNVIDEQRKRREFLYHIYRSAQHGNSQPYSGPLNRVYMLGFSQEMRRNWVMKGNQSLAPILHYHLAEGNISATTPHAEPPHNGLSEINWNDPMNVYLDWVYITHKGIKTVENDHDLWNHTFYDGGIVDWNRTNTTEQQTVSDLDKPAAATPQSGGINFGPINSAGNVNINLSNVAGGNQTTTTTATTSTQQTSPAAANPSNTSLSTMTPAQFNELLRQQFNESELKDICFALNIDYESLAGNSKADKTRELILYLQRRGRVPELLILVKEERPHISWPDTISD